MVTELLHLLTDPAHWAFEGVTDLVFGGVGILIGRFWLKGHDRKHHNTDKYVTVDMLTEIFRVQNNLDELRRRRRSTR